MDERKAVRYNLAFKQSGHNQHMDDIVYSDKKLNLIKKTDQFFIEKIPFNQYLGMKVGHYGEEPLRIQIDIRPELLGNFPRDMIHGGVTLSLLDAVGGMRVFREVIKRFENETENENEKAVMDALMKISTVTLSTQFLRPGIGQSFIATANVTRLGSKVAFVDMQMTNQDQNLIATATGVYSVS